MECRQLNIDSEFILYGFLFGSVVWGICRALGYCFQCTKFGINDV